MQKRSIISSILLTVATPYSLLLNIMAIATHCCSTQTHTRTHTHTHTHTHTLSLTHAQYRTQIYCVTHCCSTHTHAHTHTRTHAHIYALLSLSLPLSLTHNTEPMSLILTAIQRTHTHAHTLSLSLLHTRTICNP